MIKLRHALILSAAIAALLFFHPARVNTQRAREQFNGHDVVPGEVLVRVRDLLQLMDVRQQTNAIEDRPIGNGEWRRIRSNTWTVQALIQILAAGGLVDVEPNYILEAISVPNDPSLSSLWGLSAASPGIHAATAWDLTTGSPSTVVGVIDTGIDYDHPDLAANVWAAPTAFTVTVGGSSITCPAGSHGFNAIKFTCDPADDNGHGTHVSGTIGAIGNNSAGVVGVNWQTRIMGLKFLDASGTGSTADAINAIDFAIQVKAFFAANSRANVRVLSNSYGGGGYQTSFFNAISRANSANMLFAAAAGNSGLNNDAAPFYPASYPNPNMLAVAASDQSDARAGFSNYGAHSVHLAAPGVNILSTTPGNSYGWGSGTSMATPHVSGAAALVLSACQQTTPQLVATLMNTVDLVPAFAGITVTGGRLNVDRAVRACATLPTVTLNSPSNGATYTQPAQIALAATAADPDGIARVEFYDGTTLIGPWTTPPYGGTWSNVALGGHDVTAVAYDIFGLSTAATTAHVTVNATQGGNPQTLLTTQAPTASNLNDGVTYELGVRLRSDVDGQITALRYWKGTSETGLHVGHVWTTSGQPLATVTFTNESASGWQQQPLAAPVTITANTDYVVSVTTGPDRNFVAGWSMFAAPVINAHLRSVANGGRFGPLGTAPTTVSSSNYFRDVVFLAGGLPDNAPPVVTSLVPADASTVSGTVALSVSATDDVGVAGVQFLVDGNPIGAEVQVAPYGMNWDSSSVSNGAHVVAATARDGAGHTASTSVTLTVTNSGTPPQTLLTTQVPTATNVNDGVTYELGARLRSDIDGQITALRYWKGTNETGPHVGHVWTTSGQLLATVTFTNESASGWQEQALTAPVPITANTDCVVSVTTGPDGNFVAGWSMLGAPLINGHLRSVANGGRFGAMGVAPSGASSNNYFRDVKFVVGGVPDNSPPVVTNLVPADGSLVSGMTAVSVTATDDVGVAGVQFKVDGNPIGAEVQMAPYGTNWDSFSVSNGAHTVTATARDSAGHITSVSVIVAVSNVGPPPQTLLTTQVPTATNVNDGVTYELGVQLRSDVDGQITALRYWKGTSETGPHVGHVWTTSGQSLATVTFTNETASGWQEQALPAPVTVTANTDYLVSVATGPDENFVAAWTMFTSPMINGHLRSMTIGGRYGAAGAAPTRASAANYFRDVVFLANVGPMFSGTNATK